MRKTGKQIEADVFELVSNSDLKTFIKGKIYKGGTRPVDSNKEDAVISFKTGLDGQFQPGEVSLNIYVPDIDNGGKTLVENIERTTILEAKADEIVRMFTSSEYLFSLGGTPQTFQLYSEDTKVKQHFVNIKLRYTRNSLIN